ncbi:MAG TPA: permease [Candidatus Baltobacteraceae bacterium]
MIVLHASAAGLLQALAFLWDSVYGLVFGFLVSAIVQVALTPTAMQRYLGPNLRGILYAAGFGIISSSCSYGSAAAARGFYQRGADLRSVFSFLVSSTNMNVAILVLFWSLLGWKFAFAEFFGGIIIIAVVTTGISLLFKREELERLTREHPSPMGERQTVVTECPICGMKGERQLGVPYRGRTYLACGRKHYDDFSANPERYVEGESNAGPRPSLRDVQTWRSITETALNDVRMLRTELIAGYLIAGFAAALVPKAWLSHALQTVGSVPYIGYLLLLIAGLLIAVVTFVCSMGNVPVARFLANAGIPLGANTVFIYGDLLIPPLVAIYRKSFPPRVTWTFVALFTLGALIAGAIMGMVIGNAFGGIAMGSMALNDRLTIVLNALALGAIATLTLVSRIRTVKHEPA